MSQIAIIGAGAFGTALGISLARQGHEVTLVARDPDHVDAMQSARENASRLPGIAFPDGLNAALTLADSTQIILLAVPTQTLSAVLMSFGSNLSGKALVACNKGLDLKTGKGPTAIIAEHVPDAIPAILSGPSFATDIAAGLPTALTLATQSEENAETLQKELSTGNIRLYRTTDVIGVEIGGALKNVVAIAAGISLGAGLGESARASLITRGYAEMTRFAALRGAKPDTLAGLAGLGDLILTCTSEKSRNYSHGLAIGRGETPSSEKTVEGVATAKIVSKLAKDAGLSTPVCDAVNAILIGKINVSEARELLLSRPLKEE